MKFIFQESQLSNIEQQLIFDQELLFSISKQQAAIIRCYEPKELAVIHGCSQKPEEYINIENCKVDGIPIIKRFSGGGTVLLQPGCLVFSVISPYNEIIKKYEIHNAYINLLKPICDVLAYFNILAQFAPPCDLTLNNRKISGNAQAQKAGAVIVHGSLLINANIDLIERYLLHPKEEPAYRVGRSHTKFLCNLKEFGIDIKALQTKFKTMYAE